MANKILTEDHRNLLTKLLKECAVTDDILQKCADCHLDVDKEMRQNREQQAIATELLKRFFPERA